MTKVLLIEDMDELRDDVLEILKMEGYDVYGAEDGLSGLDVATSVHPDLIVCDITMPGMDGYGVLEHIRKNPDVATTPFIFLTALTQRDRRRHGMVLGADDYITKPFETDELLASIKTQLKRRQELNDAANKHVENLRNNIITALPHELRTPLNTIIGFSEMMMMEAQHLKADQVIDWASRINDSGHRLLELVEDYLYYVRLQTIPLIPEQRAKYQDAQFDMIHFLIESEALRHAGNANRESDLTVEVKEPPHLIQVQHEDIVKILTELLENAFKFSKPGDAVLVRGEVYEDMYEICIEDSGRGLTHEQISQIGPYVQFDRDFFEQQGIGFGLVLVKSLMELYQGRIHIAPADPGLCVKVAFHLSTD